MAISRRAFLVGGAATGGGLVVGYMWWRRRRSPGRSDSPRPHAYVHVGADDSVTFVVDESEMGQGVHTSLPMILAEELDADWSKVRHQQAPTDKSQFGSQWTASSTSIRRGYDKLRNTGAAARLMLIGAAAQRWGVEASECTTERGVVLHAASGKRARYGELAEAAAKLTVPSDPALKDPSTFRIIGSPTKRLDLPAKVDGSAVFGIDVTVPGLLVASVERCPIFGGALSEFDDSAAKKIEGVRQVVQVPGGVAVVADHFWAASQGRKALRISWKPGTAGLLEGEAITESLRTALGGGERLRHDGDADRAASQAGQKLEAIYLAPYLAHAAMEPLNCTAHVRDGGAEIWVGHQSPVGVLEKTASWLGVPESKVIVHTTLLGGGFGRRSARDFVKDAVFASKAVGAPVKVIWTREDDVRAGFYRPASAHRLMGALGPEGWPVAWRHEFSMAHYRTEAEGALELPYEIPNLEVRGAHTEVAIAGHAWRSVAHSAHGWVTECFIDELAAAGGKDPVALRLHLLQRHSRHLAVVQRAAKEARWSEALPTGRARGFALHESFGTIVAQVAELSIVDGAVRVHRVICVVDCGQVINPDTVQAQMESGIVYGMSAALYGKIDIAQGRAVQSNFHDYPVVRIDEMPAIDTHIIASTEKPGGVGEPGTPPIAPAICNALFALTGHRIRELPIELEPQG